ncbi:MAG: helix-turn-helix domain-containing protein [Candidatus Zixiibacteriota bacterium]
MAARKEREKEARRALILDAAARVFSRKSYPDATLDEIASEAELAKGTLYLYFKDKQDMFVSLIRRGHLEILGTIEDLLPEQKSLEEFIRHSLEMFLQKVEQHRYMMRMVMSAGVHLPQQECARILTEWKEQREKATEVYAGMLREFPEVAHLNKEENDSAARLILGTIRIIFSDCSCDGQTDIPKNEIENFARFLTRAFSVEK